MKIVIGPYKNWFGPYQLAEILVFWKPADDDLVFEVGNFLAYGRNKRHTDVNKTWLYQVLEWIHEFRKRKVYIRIDPYDTWNADDTLALIVLPMLLQLKQSKHGAPYVDNLDVPENLRAPDGFDTSNGDIDEKFQDRWDYVLDEMIWAFDAHINNREDSFFTHPPFDPNREVGDLSDIDQIVYDKEGHTAFIERKANGFRLFGKYYMGLWD